jgi:tRNA-uridine 2-sulfurtransferase
MLNKKAILLFSGGLDSLLAAKILMQQGIKIKGVFFKHYFFSVKDIRKRAAKIKLPLWIVDISKQQLKIVLKPQFGYGKNLNPCIDCRLLMLKEAKKILEKKNYSFIVTGEVLDERPMSQKKKTMLFLEKEAGLESKILRPLSAKLLPITYAEEKGLVFRDKLYGIRGRGRKKQIYLAKKFGFKDYPNPAGGCLLTDSDFSKRMKAFLDSNLKPKEKDISLLYCGRHFWIESDLIVVGRKEDENKEIRKLKRAKDILIELKNIAGPTTLIRSYNGKIKDKTIKKAKKLTKYYSLKARDKKQVEFKYVI